MRLPRVASHLRPAPPHLRPARGPRSVADSGPRRPRRNSSLFLPPFSLARTYCTRWNNTTAVFENNKFEMAEGECLKLSRLGNHPCPRGNSPMKFWRVNSTARAVPGGRGRCAGAVHPRLGAAPYLPTPHSAPECRCYSDVTVKNGISSGEDKGACAGLRWRQRPTVAPHEPCLRLRPRALCTPL